MKRAAIVLGGWLACCAGAGAAGEAFEWEPGSVFREYTYLPRGVRPDDGNPRAHFSEIDPGTKREDKAAQAKAARAPRILPLDTQGVRRAEFFMEYWSGHAGTTAWFRVNRNTWSAIPRPVGTPREPERYYHTQLGNRVVPLDVNRLKAGENIFAFTAGPQIESGFDWGFFWVYSFTVRLYHPRSDAHPVVRIANIQKGDTLSENPEIRLEAAPGAAPIERVDVFACYEDFNYSGSGLHREWHALSEYGKPKYHVGTATAAPWRVTWNTEWVPDQNTPVRLVARAVDADGWHAVSEIVDELTLARPGREIVMCRALDMPTLWGVRVGAEKSCGFEVPSGERRLGAAKIKIMTWSGDHADVIRFNGVQLPVSIGRTHDYQIDDFDVPVALIKPGRNTFSVKSTSSGHPAEVGWPGPVLLLEYR